MTNLYLTATTTDSVSMLATFIPLILMIVIFYFLLIRPQKKRDKEVQKMRENIEIADEIVTIGGISLANIRSLYDEGFRSFAMISAIVGQKDIKGAVEKIRRTLR